MNQFLNYLVPGVADGSVYALAAIGLVLTYKTSGVFNFAHGALAAVGAYVFYSGYVSHGLPWPVAFLISLVVVGILGGLVLERLATLLASAPTVTTVVATVGLLVLFQSLMTAIYGASDKKSGDFLPSNGPQIGSVTVSYGDMMVTGFCVGAALALFIFFGRTRMGRAMTAVVDDPNLLALQKSNPPSSAGCPGCSGPASRRSRECCWRRSWVSPSASWCSSSSRPTARRRSACSRTWRSPWRARSASASWSTTCRPRRRRPSRCSCRACRATFPSSCCCWCSCSCRRGC